MRALRLLVLLMCLPTLSAADRPGPEMVSPQVISTGDFESHIEFTPDGQTAYFLRSLPNFAFWTIYESHFANGRWSVPRDRAVSSVNEFYPRADDAGTLYFGSDRPGGVGGVDWRCRSDRNGRYLPAENLGPAVNSTADEYEGYVSPDGG
jgi:hypothetical protein